MMKCFKSMLLRNVLLFLLAFLPLRGVAQEDAEFRMEIGGALGTSFYLGDVNSSLYKNPCGAVSGLWRYLFDHHNAIKVMLSMGGIKGTGNVSYDYYPQDPGSGIVSTVPYIYRFSGTVTDLCCMYELNFWPYGYYCGYMGYKRLTPFIQLGMGFTYTSTGKQATANIPLGFGVKYRLGKRLNLALDWTMHFSLSDKLDNYENPQGIKSEGLKNKDSYSLTMLSLTYSFAPICPNCNKD